MFYNREFLGYKVPTYSQSTKYQTNSCTFTSYSSNLYNACFTPEREGKNFPVIKYPHSHKKLNEKQILALKTTVSVFN